VKRPAQFTKDSRHIVGDGGVSPAIEFRFGSRNGELWFALYAHGFRSPMFSGLVSDDWPQNLRDVAHEAEVRLKEKP
jgi:hypothetical protein